MSIRRTINRLLAEVSCDHCQTTFTVDRGEDGGATLETWPCQEDSHTHRLCEECKVACFSCDCTFCVESTVLIGHHRYCGLCASGINEGRLKVEGNHAA